MYFKSILLVILLTNGIWASCLTQSEIEKIKQASIKLDKWYGDVPNYIECAKDRTHLEEFVCENEDFLLLFQYLSQENVYSYENAMKYEVNHKTFNIKNMDYWTKTYSKNKMNTNELCNDLRESVESVLED